MVEYLNNENDMNWIGTLVRLASFTTAGGRSVLV